VNPTVTARPSRNVPRDAFIAFALAYSVGILLGVLPAGHDAILFQNALRSADPYAVTDYAGGSGFYYTPVAALLLRPIILLPPPLLVVGWFLVECACLWYLAGRWSIVAIFIPIVFWELWSSNFALVFAAVSVAGVRRPALWAIPLLTKVTPGIGILWFAVRREWRSLAIVMGVTLAAIAISLLTGWWPAYVHSLAANAGFEPPYYGLAIPLIPRLVAAAVLVTFGALTDRRWVLPIAVTMATPVLWFPALAALMGLARTARPKTLGLRADGPGRLTSEAFIDRASRDLG
jgi:hypothetical protein